MFPDDLRIARIVAIHKGGSKSNFINYRPVSVLPSRGSILGPLLFLLYINDILNVTKSLYFIMFADDTNIFLSHNCIDTLESNMNIEIEKLVKWMSVNRLSLNGDKTKATIFSNNFIDKNISIKMAGNEVQFVDKIKFLGVIIDKKLQWRYHIDYIVSKLAKLQVC